MGSVEGTPAAAAASMVAARRSEEKRAEASSRAGEDEEDDEKEEGEEVAGATALTLLDRMALSTELLPRAAASDPALLREGPHR